ncbi:zinc ABC transporter solute-binding protein [Halomonas sp. MCCC 1A17488]|uniref:metal ABC transporter solute-binding protein, Zn/Mn family n=1 Tax=unclassified Halomonas TaxID=2609666 RepID=UPI0018D23A97|nr:MULTISPECIES: zinc ABC transporter substrate-binding protein [unclassified Halomonas]MCE8016946.1 zinc ABC transporter solute-binding protein [Halomonas sp. MCCC 1A17488]MCG3240279.1 zinc ABC transporter solute-binding protein [Halomonas sp. MCCC 1A17488]QPP49847.1 zinc ABC transporter substrate-binding protein [Halomonas sp. SS10-MC5]
MPLPRGWMLLSALALALSNTAHAEESPLRVATTFSVLGDLVREVAGDDAEVEVLTPVGAEVHEWELVPSNFVALEKADVVLYNGYGLEQWIGQVEATVGDDVPLVALAEESGYATQPIATGDFAGEADPHMWMDPRAAAEYARVAAEVLAEARPDAADAFRSRAEALGESLHALHDELTESLATIPEERRLLITSEAAFLYFADAFGFEHDGIWGNNAEQEGSPHQVMRIVDKIEERQPAAIFWESTISDRHVRSVASETEVKIAGPLYVDSLSEPEGEAPDYPGMLRHNVQLLLDTLGGER